MKALSLFVFSLALIIFGLQPEKAVQATAPEPAIFDSDKLSEPAKPVGEGELRAASAKAIKVMQHSQGVWYNKQTCTSCHHQLLPEIALKLARERGVPFDETIARDTTATAFANLKDVDAEVQGHDYIDVVFNGWILVAARAAGIGPSLATSASAQFIASRQLADGSWPTIDQRPPQSHSLFTTTAVCAQALQLFLPEQFKSEREARVRRARDWLLREQPRTTEDSTFRLLGLLWTGAAENARQKAARQLLAEQRADGGWAQLPGRASDAYATGEVLFVLHEAAGLATESPSYQRGLSFLLKAQAPDGSWRIKSRLHPPAPVSPPYVNVEFPPFQHDQFISMMGTSWATSALLEAIKRQEGGSKKQMPASAATNEQPEWAQVALNGSAGDLRRLLDGGLKPDSKTAEGTTALMLAARDLAKVKLLLDRGADVNARAASGVTALMVASRHRGNAEVVRLLLKKGARPNVEKGIEVRNDASALFFAVMAGDVETARLLADAGARLGDRMKVLGTIVTSPLLYATFLDDSAMVEYLISNGADPNEVDDDRISVLEWAAISNRVSTVQLLLARGAKVNHVDNHGMTPLLYAASINFGDSEVMNALIAAGADVKAKNKAGLTATELAESYKRETK
ncbi:MAG TPA: ankyrin repeat domain-containing protein [Blastocatellia bacterium]|nr:ankyrin repeat domain-containing protein [Blastocatellia bacterium]